MTYEEEGRVQKALAMRASGCRNELEWFLMILRNHRNEHQVAWSRYGYHVKVRIPDGTLDLVTDGEGNLSRPVYKNNGEEAGEIKEIKTLDDALDYLFGN